MRDIGLEKGEMELIQGQGTSRGVHGLAQG